MLIKYKKVNILNVGADFRLVPGNNNIPEAKWEAALKLYPKLRYLVEEGHIETYTKTGAVRDEPLVENPAATGEAAKGEPPLEVEDLAALNQKKAVRLVKDTYDVDILTAWHETEKRAEVIKAIEGQFTAIAKAGEPEKKAAE